MSWGTDEGMDRPSPKPVAFPAHALLILEERLREQEAEGIRMPEGMELDGLALRILLASELSRKPLTA